MSLIGITSFRLLEKTLNVSFLPGTLYWCVVRSTNTIACLVFVCSLKWSSGQRVWLGKERFEFDIYQRHYL